VIPAAPGVCAPPASAWKYAMSNTILTTRHQQSCEDGHSSKPGGLDIQDLKLVGPKEVAGLVGVSTRQVSRWLSDGTLPPYDFAKGQTKRWRIGTIRAWIEASRAPV
jgi:predicted DNA-binding transcriptional regulator AlpA